MTIRRPTNAQLRRAVSFYFHNWDDQRHGKRAHYALLRLGRELDEDNLKHNPRRKK